MIDSLLNKAEQSKCARLLLSQILQFVIPFNAPHRFAVQSLSSERCQILIPYKRKNRNHIHGLHACAMATACEFSTGLLLLRALSTSSHRIVMKELHMQYFFQGKMNAIATCQFSLGALEEKVLGPLQNEQSIEVSLTSEVVDKEQNKLSQGNVLWQIKPWKYVRTKL